MQALHWSQRKKLFDFKTYGHLRLNLAVVSRYGMMILYRSEYFLLMVRKPMDPNGSMAICGHDPAKVQKFQGILIRLSLSENL
jgi:hypothetical protein